MEINFNPKSQKYLSAKESLPKNLHAIYDQLVKEYMFHTAKRYGRGYVAYDVLADLVRDGWRPHEEAKKEEKGL
jgi:hypothetical protein